MTSEVDKLGSMIAQGISASDKNAQRMSVPGTIHTRFNFNKYILKVRNTKTLIEETSLGSYMVWDQDKWDEEYWVGDDLDIVTDELTTTTYKNTTKTTATWTGSGSIIF